MAYIRKTHDEYEIQSNYGYGWGCETIEESWSDAKRTIKCYRDNCPGVPFRIVKKRVKNVQ